MNTSNNTSGEYFCELWMTKNIWYISKHPDGVRGPLPSMDFDCEIALKQAPIITSKPYYQRHPLKTLMLGGFVWAPVGCLVVMFHEKSDGVCNVVLIFHAVNYHKIKFISFQYVSPH